MAIEMTRQLGQFFEVELLSGDGCDVKERRISSIDRKPTDLCDRLPSDDFCNLHRFNPIGDRIDFKLPGLVILYVASLNWSNHKRVDDVMNPEMYVQALEEVLSDPTWHILARQSAQRFSWSIIAQSYRDVILETLGNRTDRH